MEKSQTIPCVLMFLGGYVLRWYKSIMDMTNQDFEFFAQEICVLKFLVREKILDAHQISDFIDSSPSRLQLSRTSNNEIFREVVFLCMEHMHK